MVIVLLVLTHESEVISINEVKIMFVSLPQYAWTADRRPTFKKKLLPPTKKIIES